MHFPCHKSKAGVVKTRAQWLREYSNLTEDLGLAPQHTKVCNSNSFITETMWDRHIHPPNRN